MPRRHHLTACQRVPAPACSDTTARHQRTLDEAFKTPAWRNPVQGPFRRPRSMGALLVWLLGEPQP